MTTKKLNKPKSKFDIEKYANDRFDALFGSVDDFEQERQMLLERMSDLRTKSDVDECLEILLEVYKDHYEDYMPQPKSWE